MFRSWRKLLKSIHARPLRARAFPKTLPALVPVFFMAMNYYIYIAALIILAFAYFYQVKSGSIKSYSKRIFRFYRLSPSILSQSELILYRVIKKHFGQDYMIATKVRIADFVIVAKPSIFLPKNKAYGLFQRISSRHSDFLLCALDGTPKVWIELDDRSHNTPQAKKIDRFKNELAAAVNLPLYRIKTGSNYNKAMSSIRTVISE